MCDELPMRLFIDIYNSELEVVVKGDEAFQIYNIRYILREYDENYPIVELMPYFDKIMEEHQILSGQKSNTNHFQKLDSQKWIEYKKTGIKLAIMSIQLGYKQGAIDIINSLKLKIQPTIGALERKYKSINNRLKLQLGKEQEKIKESKTREKLIWNDLRVKIHQALKIMPDYNCSVSLYLSYEKKLKQHRWPTN